MLTSAVHMFVIEGSIAVQQLMPFVQYCAEHFIYNENRDIKYEAVLTCSKLLSPIIISSMRSPGAYTSPTVFMMVSEVLKKLLVVGVADPIAVIR